jgi:hypothetical protein
MTSHAALVERLRYMTEHFVTTDEWHRDLLEAADALSRTCETCRHVAICPDCNKPEYCDRFPAHKVTPNQLGYSCGAWSAADASPARKDGTK